MDAAKSEGTAATDTPCATGWSHTLAKRPQSSCSSSATERERDAEAKKRGQEKRSAEKVTHWG